MRRWLSLLALIALGLLPACSRQPSPSPPPFEPPLQTSQPTDTEPPEVQPTLDETPGEQPATDTYADERNQLVDWAIVGRGIREPAVVVAMRAVQRHLFVPQQYVSQAYEDHPLPIGYGQTISQPYIVALMTESLELEPDDVVLEIGTGSGYQAAVLAEIVAQVYTIEIIGALAEQAANRLASLGYDNVEVMHADGYYGWEEHAPFDAIIVTAAPDHVPPPLRAQLADGGHMVIPVGPVGGYQELWLIKRSGDEFITTSLGGVIFVQFTREKRDE